MDDDIARRVYSDPVARWFVTEAYRITDTAELVAAAGEQLVLSGIPLYRLAYFQLTLHPEFAGKGYFWRRGRGVETGTRPHGDNQDSDYRDNPLPPVLEQQKTVRVRLDRVEPQAPLLRQLKDEGATDYVALPLLFTTGHVDALSVVSDRAGRLLDERPRPHVPAAVRLHAAGRDPFPARQGDLPARRLCRPRRRPAHPGGRGPARRGPDHRGGDLVLRPARLHPRLRHACRATPSSRCSTTTSTRWARWSPAPAARS